MSARGKYADYTVRIADDDMSRHVRYDENRHGHLLRVHYRISRVPSRREFVVRNYADATAADRAEVSAMVERIPAMFAYTEQHHPVPRRLARGLNYYFWSWPFGTLVDDPLVQLELETMIDLESGDRMTV